ncbi:MAG: methyltransferase domain-containing protein [Chloroflexota bacterium]
MIKSHLHVVPEENWDNQRSYLGYLRHLKAYEFASQFIKDKLVLELGCGSGYGLEYLFADVEAIIGFDMGWDALLEAQTLAPSTKDTLVQGLAHHLPFADNTFDVILSFQVIEHVDNVSAYLKELYRVLKPNGVFCVSTPNKSLRLLPFQKPWNPYHAQEFTAYYLQKELSIYFKNVIIHGLYGSPDTQAFEEARVRQSPLSVYSKMLIPPTIHKVLGLTWRNQIRARIRPQSKAVTKTVNHTPEDFEKYTLGDYQVEQNTVKCIDLIGICVKE